MIFGELVHRSEESTELSALGMHDDLRLMHSKKLANLCRMASKHRIEAEENEIVRSILDEDFVGVDTDLGSLSTALAGATEISDTGLGEVFENFLISRDFQNRWGQLSGYISDLDEAVTVATGIGNRIASLGRIDTRQYCGAKSLDDASLDALNAKADRCLSNAGSLVAYVDFIRRKVDAAEPGLREIIECFEASDRHFDGLAAAYDKVLYHSICRAAYVSHPDLNRFSGLSQQEARARFQDLDRQILELGRKQLTAILSNRPIETGVGVGPKRDYTDRSLILNELSKKKRHIPLRKLLDRAGTAIQQMKPCFMMSPHSVSQFLKPAGLEFDLLVIDEASQMRPEFALGAIARTKQIVVVGDPKQLPPTSFFDRLDDTQDDEEEDEGILSESILDLALSVFRPARRLRSHYRSHHESLIAFSNKEFYDGKLIVFPSPFENHPDYGVNFVEVKGHYRGRMNVPEAQRVTEAAVELMHKRPEWSLAIVALNQPQRELIVDEMDRIFARDSACEDYRAKWDNTLVPFIVKNTRSRSR